MRNMVYIVYLSLSMFMLTGCLITPMQAAKGIVTVKRIGAEKIADKVLRDNVKQVCTWPTIGSLEREYGDNPTKYRAYRKFCGHAQ